MGSGFIKSLTIHLLAILFVMLNLGSAKSVGTSHFMPLFDLMVIYYFAVYQRIFQVWFLFLLGLWSDSLSGMPLGISSFSYIIICRFFIALNQRLSIGENFRQILQQFALFLFFVLGCKWLIISAYHSKFYNFTPLLQQLVISVPLYVVMHKFFDYMGQKLTLENNASGF